MFTARNGAWDGASGLTFTLPVEALHRNRRELLRHLAGDRQHVHRGRRGRRPRASPRGLRVEERLGGDHVFRLDADEPACTALDGSPGTQSGAPQDTATITADSPASDWDGVSGLTQTYQFSRCDSGGVNCNTVVQSGSSNTYVLKPADIGSTIRVVASASISTSATVSSLASPATSIITPLLLANGAPAAPTGAAQDGKLLTAGDNGNWADEGSLGFKYQWFQCTSSSNSSCTTSLGAASASNTYTLKPTDVGTRIVVVVTAFVGAGAASSMSAAVARRSLRSTPAPP